jgi:sulfite exporter TauE/SafE
MGLENIEKNMRELLLSSIDNKSFSPGRRSNEPARNSIEQENDYKGISGSAGKNSSYFVYFYTSSCSDCNNTQNFLKTLSSGYMLNIERKTVNSPLVIDHKNITQENNLVLLQSLFEYYNVPKDKREVPVMFYSKGYISGYDHIKKNMEKIIIGGEALNFDYDRLNQENNIKSLTPENIPGIFFTGLINGINPCSISMLFLLLSLVISKKSNILKFGFSYIAGKMAAYYSFGIAAYHIITVVDSTAFRNVQYGISIFMVIMSLILALLNFRDAYWARKEIYSNVKMQLPGSLRKYNHRIITFFAEKADSGWTVFVIFILGVIISLGEFLCTGQIYVATIVYLAQNTSGLTGTTVLSFVLYVLAASLPLILLVILVNRTKRLLQVSELVRRHLPVIKIIFGVTFLIFGLIFAIYII